MNLKTKWLMLALMLTFSAVFLVSSVHATGVDGGYVGTSACIACHDGSPASNKTSFLKTGHPYKVRFTDGLTPVASGAGAGEINDPLSALLTPKLPNYADLLNPNNEADAKVDTTPADGKLDWGAVSYVIGGYGWKARWGVKDIGSTPDTATGYIWSSSVSTPTGAQYNMLADNYSTYGSATKAYSCAICHNTNGTSSADAGCITALGSGRTEPWASSGLLYTAPGGFKSEWSLSGVQCEACHGKGSNATNTGHADSVGTQGVLTLAGGVEICAKCHIRAENTNGAGAECGGDSNPAILTNGAKSAADFVNHHEQYNEMVGLNSDGAHASLTCTTCHDPHKRAAGVTASIAAALGITGDNTRAEAGAIKKQCTDCHYGKDNDGAANIAGHAGVTCVDCHMAEATKSATATSGTWGKIGDVKSHIFAINPAGTTLQRSNGQPTPVQVAVNALPLRYSCGKCHDITVKPTAVKTYANEAAASADATGYHGAAITNRDGGYVGTAVCATCHTTQNADFQETGHPWKVRFTDGKTPYDDGTCDPGTITGSTICDPLSTLLTPKMPLMTALLNIGTDDIKTGCGSTNLDWSCVDYVIGGYGWKARWGIKSSLNTCGGANDEPCTGYIWSSTVGSTALTGAQFNMLAADTTLDPADARADYSSYGSASGKKYSCAICHNTNGTSSIDANCITPLGSGRTEPWASSGLNTSPTGHGGFNSEWTFSGVQCEACHGAGLAHATAASPSNITNNPSKDACGKCHIRATNTAGFGGECGGTGAILTNGAQNNGGTSLANQSVQHHEQYNELVGYNGDGAHASLNCVSCHEPHKRSHKVTNAIATALGITDNGQSAETRGAVASCESCHPGKTLVFNMGNIKCVDCHMAETTKSATLVAGTWGAQGDVKGHIFKINPSAATMDRTNAGSVHIATNYITVNYACGKCHDATLSTHVSTTFTQAAAQVYAAGIHAGAPTAVFTYAKNGLTVGFNASASYCQSGNCSYSWDFGQTGGTTTGGGTATPTHTYTSGGTFNVTLTVTDNVNSTTDVKTASITVSAPATPPTCDFATSVSGGAVTVTETVSTDVTKQAIIWGDGSVAQTTTGNTWSPLSHTYTVAGTYNVALKVKNAAGLTCTAKHPVTITTTKYNISGHITSGGNGVSGVTVTITGPSTWRTVYTDGNGLYAVYNLKAGTYTVTPSKTGITFTPTSLSITLGPTVTNADFTSP